jgi:endonuclease/exonuclease/phosphatase (EEP) superfamily protein YafD
MARERLRRLLFVALVCELAAIVIFLAIVLLGERSRATLVALYLPRHPLLAAALLGAALAPFTRRRVRPLVAAHLVMALVVLFAVMGFNLGRSREDGKDGIRLASYNVYFGKLGRPELLDELADMPVDILTLQATNDSLGERLRERFPDRHVHQEHELVLVSKFKIKNASVPPPLDDGAPAMFVEYVLETPNGDLRVINVHPYSPRHALFGGEDTSENIEHREAQIRAAVDAARKDGPPFVLVGDTNLPVLSSIARRSVGRMRDAFEEVGFGFGYTFPSKRPWMRIDRAFADDGIRFLSFEVGPKGHSDHRPIFVTFTLENGR